MNERSIFLDALELTDPEQRRKHLDRACGDDQELRDQVEELLVSHNDASSFLEKPPEGLVATIAADVDETVGESLGGDSLEFLDPTDKPGCLGTLSQYEVVEVVGRGGMGIVLRAYDTKLNRVVAIKVMAPELAANAMAVKRFLREARAAAAVSHDHVVTIHAIEENNRPPFIVMEFVDGQSLQEKIDRDGALELNEILRIGLQMARGLEAAHEQGLVHRDIKPANILLENGVERVKLTDFGLARAVDDVSVTQTGQIAGTPQFMSPEQAQGHAIDARSDLFSFGSVLYTMCTGRPPFRADSAVAMLRRVTDDDPRPICEVNSDIPDWLEAITFKMLEKEPSQRFQSAEAAAELLSQYLAHLQHPTTAPKPPRVGFKKPAQQSFDLDEELGFIESTLRIYGWIALMWAALAIVFATVVFAFPGNYTATFFKLNASWALGTGVCSLIAGLLAFVGRSHVGRRDSYRGALIGNVAALFPVNPILVWAVPVSIWSLIKLRNPKVRNAFTPGTFPTRSWPMVVSVSAIVGCLMLFLVAGIVIYVQTNEGTLVIESDDENVEIMITRPRSDTHEGLRVHVVDRITGSEVVRLPSGHYRLMMMKGPDSNTNVDVQSLRLSKEQFVLKRGDQVVVRVTKKPRQIASPADSTGRDLKFADIRRFKGHDKQINTLAISADGQRAVTAGEDDTFRVWEIQTERELMRVSRKTSGQAQNADISPDGRYVALAGAWESGEIEIWDAGKSQKVRPIDAPKGSTLVVAFSPDGRLLASGGKNRTVWLWDVQTGEKLAEMQGHADTVCSLAFSPPGRTLLSGSFDNSIRLWDVESGTQVREYTGIGGHIRRLEFSPSGDQFVASSYNKVFALWNVAKTQPIRTFRGHREKPSALIFTPDGRHVVSGSPDKTLRVWEVATAREVARFEANAFTTNLVAPVANTNLLVTGGGWNMDDLARKGDGDYSIYLRRLPESVWPQAEAETNEITEVRRFEGHTDFIEGVAFSADGSLLLTGSPDKTVRLWDAATSEELMTLNAGEEINSVAVSPSGHIAAAGLGSGRIVIWDLADGSQLWRIAGHDKPSGRDNQQRVMSLEFSPDGKRLLSGGDDGSVRTWDVENGGQLQRFEGTGSPVQTVTWSFDGSKILAAEYAGVFSLWDMKSGKRIQRNGEARDKHAAFAPDSRRIVSGLKVFDSTSVEVLTQLQTDQPIELTGIQFTTDGRFVVAGVRDASLRVWDAMTGHEVARVDNDHWVTQKIDVSPDGRHVASGGGVRWDNDAERLVRDGDYALRLWRLPESVWPTEQPAVEEISEVSRLEGHADIVGALDFLPDGKSLASGSQQLLYHWDLATDAVIREIPVDSPVKGLVALPDGQHVITSHEDGAITMWNLADGLVVRQFTGHTDEVHEIAVSTDGKRLLSGGFDGLVRLWDVGSGEPIHNFKEPVCTALALSHDGKLAAHGGTSLVVQDLESGDTLQTMKRQSGSINAVAFSPDGRFVLAGDYYGVIEIWQVATGRQMGRLSAHNAAIKSLLYTPDGRYFVSSSFDQTILLFDTISSRFIARAKCDDHSTTFLAMAPDGQSLASSGGYWLEPKDRSPWESVLHKDREFPIRLWRLPRSVVQSETTTNSLGMKLRLIPAGEFEMGTADDDVEALAVDDAWFFADFISDRHEAETPRHNVTISKPFEMSEHEVTVRQFRLFIEVTDYKTTAEQEGEGYGWRNGEWQKSSAFNWRNPGFEQADDHPVCNVSWDDTTEFCRWLSEKEGVTYRLPTEAEWEYACRAGTTTLFWTGDEIDSIRRVANVADATLRKQQPNVTWAVDWEDEFAATAAVGSFRPNAFGLQDIHGNASEWCQDVYDEEWYETSPATDPVRRGSGRHVFRGGGFDNWAGFVRSADRYSSHSETLFTEWAGFRVVRELSPESDQDGTAK